MQSAWPNSQTQTQQAIFEFAPDDKRKFAAAILKNPKPLEAAISVFGGGPSMLGKALFAANNWPEDFEVLALKQELLADEGNTELLPSKAKAARRVWEWTEAGQAPSKERLEAMRLYCEMQNFIDKPGSSNVSVTMPPVIKFVLAEDDAASGTNTNAVAAAA